MSIKTIVQSENQKNARPPIVVVMGHIDHGKSKILETIRQTKMLEKESGGITQHIGAYVVEHKGKKITFIDTPGHEAFSRLRSRGAKAADIAILVVAADEGVKPQTKEAIEIINTNSLPFAVAINKIDKPEANTERVKQQLADAGVLVESYGGKIPSVETSAKAGTNLDELLEVILLLAELENLKVDSAKPAEGLVLEAHRDPKRGITATLLILGGNLTKKDALVIGRSLETIKIFEDFRGRPIEYAGPSTPVLVAGQNEMPSAGDPFQTFTSREQALVFIKSLPDEEAVGKNQTPISTEERPIFNIVLKTDVMGSKEALEESLKKIESELVGINIIRSEVGDINESDVKMAQATKLVTVVGFKVKIDSSARELAENFNIHIVTGEVIYELLDKVKRKIEELLPPEVKKIELGRVKILKLFKNEGIKQVVGGKVEEGIIKAGAKVDILRLKTPVGKGTLIELQQNKQKTEEVARGLECGMMIESKTEIQEGDVLEIFSEETIKRTL